MAWSWGDGFDLYAASTDAANGYWDSSPASLSFVAGRFAGSQAARFASSVNFVKTSGVNDAVHHFVLAYRQTASFTGTFAGIYLELFDGATAQCSVVFRSDGAILLTSGGPVGTTLATFTGGVPVSNTWYAYEFEVVIHPSAGSFTVRRNGNPSNDFTATGLNTRPGTNSYANKLQFGMQSGSSGTQDVDDLFWRSDASAVAWMGDMRCIARMPASDVSVQFSRSPAVATQAISVFSAAAAKTNGIAIYIPFTASFTGPLTSATISVSTAATGHVKAAVYDSAHNAVLATSSEITNPVIGLNTVTFASPPAIVKGTSYYFAIDQDVTVTYNLSASNAAFMINSTAYASFPVANPQGLTSNTGVPVVVITYGSIQNSDVVSEPQQDAATSYVYSSTPGQADFYGIAGIASTPSQVFATTVRALAQKSDAGTRTLAAQLKSGATTVASPTVVLTTSNWQWAWRTDVTDPATGAAWTPAGVNNAQVGAVVVA